MQHTLKTLAGVLALSALCVAQPGRVGTQATPWTGLKDLDGKAVSLGDFQGKVVMLMTVQYNCGGCKANAPAVGAIAHKFAGKAFQALGADINKGTVPQLKTFEALLKQNAPAVNFPLLQGVKEPELTSTNLGTKWVPYDALRDVFFVIDHAGKIVFRVDGNRGNSMGAAKHKELEDAVTAALANVSTGIASPGGDLCIRSCRRDGGWALALEGGPAGRAPSSLRILDARGALVRELIAGGAANGNRTAHWDGLDARGDKAPAGAYLLRAAVGSQSITRALPWTP